MSVSERLQHHSLVAQISIKAYQNCSFMRHTKTKKCLLELSARRFLSFSLVLPAISSSPACSAPIIYQYRNLFRRLTLFSCKVLSRFLRFLWSTLHTSPGSAHTPPACGAPWTRDRGLCRCAISCLHASAAPSCAAGTLEAASHAPSARGAPAMG